MFDVILFQPEIPPNTGNAIRLCANTGARLHLVAPLGFRMGDKEVRRAGLDYHEMACVTVHRDLASCLDALGRPKMYALTTRGCRSVYDAAFRPRDALLFGPETSGLPDSVLDGVPTECRLRLPMVPGNRSLNLSNAVAITVFEAWRQSGFAGADGRRGTDPHA